MSSGRGRAVATAERAVTAVFRALADPTRRAILDVLRRGERPVGDIASEFVVSRPAVSKHLRVLRQARLVSERREGRQRIVTLRAAPMRDADAWLAAYRRFWQDQLGRLAGHVESRQRPTPRPDVKRSRS